MALVPRSALLDEQVALVPRSALLDEHLRRSVAWVERQRRRRAYSWLMGSCIVLILLAWNVVRLWSITAAVVMSVVAAVIPPAAAIVGNLGSMAESELPRAADQQELDEDS